MRGRVAALVFLFSPVGGLAADKLDVRVDPRVELLSIVFRLAGHPEYNMENSKSPYADDVEKQFGRFREHPTVLKARMLRMTNGISYDAVMSLAVHLADDLDPPRPRVPLDPRPELLEGRWTPELAQAFIEALGEFVRDTGFKAFIEQNRERYEKCAEKVAAVANQRDYVGWFDEFFGQRPKGRFTLIAGLLTGGSNYGVSMRYPDGREEITPVIGVYSWDAAGLPALGDEIAGTVVHEFCHAYTNAFVDQHYDKLEAAGKVFFDRNAAIMKKQAYASGRTVLYESLVRAVVTHYMRVVDGDPAGRKQALYEMGRGFKWTRELARAMGEYAANREKYKSFGDFMPQVVALVDEIARNYDQLLLRFPRVVSMKPANAADDVDPATTEFVVTFDRPMRDGSWSVVGGGPEFPRMDKPHYDESRRVFTMPVTLEPGKRYRFGLNGPNHSGFQSEDGYPLEMVEVSFTTRAP